MHPRNHRHPGPVRRHRRGAVKGPDGSVEVDLPVGGQGDDTVSTGSLNGTANDTVAELQATVTTNAGGHVETGLGGGNTWTRKGVTASRLQSGWFLFTS